MEKNQSDRQLNSITLLNQMASDPYYLFHFLAFFSYIPVRCSASHVLSPPFSSYLHHREIQAVIAFSLLTAIKMVRKETWEAFIADTLFFAKIFLFGIALVVDYHLALWYLLVFLVVYTLTQQPPYQGIGATLQLTPLQLEALLTDGNTSRFWLGSHLRGSGRVCLHRLNTVNCLHLLAFKPVGSFLNYRLRTRTKIYLLGLLILASSPILQKSLVSL
ncbi:uncharacterized protein LOC131316498 isoform X3 [Rhododendron vialii]|uniref:uncharacterized protein LOC131316498 isoform X3 n=1 Tax=Rhododendron vialii TaxID=182163 RepID=UPI00265DC258|nr:uncharacterized protein LOC131316498 isoform X3 [Rhododendron vialii]